MNRAELHELIDACQSPRDLARPELRSLAENVESDPATRKLLEKSFEIDASIRAAVRDVPIPAGLEERLLNSVLGANAAMNSAHEPSHVPAAGAEAAADAEADRESESDLAKSPVTLSDVTTTQHRRAGLKSWKWWTAASVAAAAALLFSLWPASETKPTKDIEIAQCVRDWTGQLVKNADDWQSSDFPLRQYPWPNSLPPQYRQWIKVSDSNGWRGVVCYDLTAKGGPPAHLFVALATHEMDLPTSAPTRPYTRVGRMAVGVWKSASVVYVLTVEGTDQQYHDMLGTRPHVVIRSVVTPQLASI
jgi:hypothetical protein